MTTFAPVAAIVAKIYDTSYGTVATCATVFFITYVLLSLTVGWVCSQIGTGRTFQLCALVTAIGLWLRYVVAMTTDKFWVMILPMTLISLP